MKLQIRTVIAVTLVILVLSPVQLDAAPPRNADKQPPTVIERVVRAVKRAHQRVIRTLSDLPMPPIPPPCTGNGC